MTPEGRVKAKVKAWLKARGIWHFSPVSNGMGMHGIPDIICCWEGRFVGLEIKAKGNRNGVTELQKRQLTQISLAGGIATVVDDVTQLEDVFYVS